MKKAAIVIWLSVLLTGIIALFWHFELVYALPTPVPKDYKAVNIGSKIDGVKKFESANKPVFFHFFNPNCPCSRFNIDHFKSLVKEYGDRVKFIIVVMNAENEYSAEAIQEKFHLNLPVYFDRAIADRFGVYSTPQAAIINNDERLYYRGNYNKSRYCTDKKTNYARAALDSLLNQKYNPVFSQLALKAYGCELPKCIK
jgi:hypothetical protein